MLFFKSCPRCEGDRYSNNDMYGSYILCLQCGYVIYPGQTPAQIRDLAKEVSTYRGKYSKK